MRRYFSFIESRPYPVLARAAYAAGMADGRSELERALAEAGGADAPRDTSARLRRLLDAELGARRARARRDAHRLRDADRGGGGRAASEVVAALPVSPELRADPGAVAERAAALAAAAVEHVVEGASPGPPRSRDDLRLRLGELDGMLALAYPAADAGRGGRVRVRGAQRRVRGEADRPPARARAPAARPRAGGGGGPAAADRRRRTRCGWRRR